MERVNDVGWQAFVKEKSHNVVAVVTGGFESYFYFAQISCYGFEPLKKQLETVQVVLDSEHIRQDFSF